MDNVNLLTKFLPHLDWRNKVTRLILDISSILLPLLIYAAVLLVGVPHSLSYGLRYEFSLAANIAIILVLYLTFQVPGWISRTLSLTLTLVLFALPLSALWNLGTSEVYTIGGLVPYSDAAGYYFDAVNIMEGGFLHAELIRPLFSGFLAAILWMAHQNLQLTLPILVATAAVSCYVAAREAEKLYGSLVAVFIVFGAFFYYRSYTGHLSSETLGLALGCLAFALLWRSIRTQQPKITIAGLFLLAIAQNVRPAALFILPATILWSSLAFRQTTRRFWAMLLGGISVTLLAFVLNSILTKWVSAPGGGPPFGNFAFTLYGLITQANYAQFFQDYPDLAQLPLGKKMEQCYAIVFRMIQENPWRLVSGALRSWQVFLLTSPYSIFSDTPDSFNYLDRYLRPLGLLGIILCAWRWRSPKYSLLFAATLGILASVPFAPLWDGGIRFYAVTIIIHSVLAAVGLSLIVQLLMKCFQFLRWSLLRRFSIAQLKSGLKFTVPLLVLFSFPFWCQLLKVPSLPIQAHLSAPGVEFVRIYWDDPQRNPDAFERIMVKPSRENATVARPGDKKIRDYSFFVVKSPWQQLQFVSENGKSVRVEQIRIHQQSIAGTSSSQFILPTQFWNYRTAAIFATLIAMVVVTLWATYQFDPRLQQPFEDGEKNEDDEKNFQSSPPSSVPVALVLGCLFVAISFFSHLSLKEISQAGTLPDQQICPAGTTPSAMFYHPASVVNLVENSKLDRSRVPNIRISDFRTQLTRFGSVFQQEVEGLSQLDAGTTILAGGVGYMAAKTSDLPKTARPIVTCTTAQQYGQFLSLHRASSIHRIKRKTKN